VSTPGLHAPTPADVEQLRHIAADTDGAPLSEVDHAFLASEQHVLQVEDGGRLVVIGVATTRYYLVDQVRAAVADAWRL
jgi:hypothetical protein